MKQLEGISDQDRSDWEAWESSDSKRRNSERQMENAAADMFDKWRRIVKARLKEIAGT